MTSPVNLPTIASTPAATSARPSPRDSAREVAQKFEAMLLGTLLEGFAPGAGVMGVGGTAGDVYGSLLREQYAQLLARSGGIGVAAAVERSLAEMESRR